MGRDLLRAPDFPKVEWLDVDKLSIKTTPYLVVILIEFKRGLAPSPGSTPGKLSTAVWVRRAGLPSLDPMGVLTHPQETSRRMRRHCRVDEKLVEREVLVKVGELSEPMDNVISKITADCLDPSGNIDKESRLV